MLGVDPQDVARRPRLERFGAEQLAELGDEVLQRGRGRLRRLLPPQLGDQPVGADDLACVHEEQSQEGALLLPAQRQRAAGTDDLERTEDSEFDHSFL